MGYIYIYLFYDLNHLRGRNVGKKQNYEVRKGVNGFHSPVQPFYFFSVNVTSSCGILNGKSIPL